MTKGNIIVLFLLAVITFVIFYGYFINQPYFSYSSCPLCDGNQYLKMYDYFKGVVHDYEVKFPYYSRALVPYLASSIPVKDPILAFAWINVIFSILGIGSLFYLWRKIEIPLYLIGIGFFWLLFHWTGLIRLNIADPITVDVPTYFIQTVFILIVLSKRYYWLLIIGPIAILQRESILVLLFLLLLVALATNYFDKRNNIPWVPIVLAIVLSILTKYLYTLAFPPVDQAKSSVRLVLFYIREVLIDPFKLIRWIVAILVAYGMFLVVAVQKLNKSYFKNEFFNFLSLQSASYLLLGIIAGGDSTRIVFLGFPFIMTWIFIILKNHSWKLSITALILSLYLMRVTEVIPDPGIDFTLFKTWYPEYASPVTIVNLTIYFIVAYLFFLLINNYWIKKEEK